MILVASVSENEGKNPEIITVSVWAIISLAVANTTSAQQWGRLQFLYSQGEIMLFAVKLLKCCLGCVRVVNFG